MFLCYTRTPRQLIVNFDVFSILQRRVISHGILEAKREAYRLRLLLTITPLSQKPPYSTQVVIVLFLGHPPGRGCVTEATRTEVGIKNIHLP